MDDRREVSAVIENHVQGLTTREARDGLLDAPVVLLLSLALPSEDGDASCGDAM